MVNILLVAFYKSIPMRCMFFLYTIPNMYLNLLTNPM